MQVLFIVHGMGANPPGWSKPIVAKLDEVALRYHAFDGGPPFSQRVKIVEICYDSVFSDLVEAWQDDLEELRALAKRESLRIPDVLRTLTQSTLPAETTSAFWSTLIDPLLYRGVSIIRDKVRALVQLQLVETLTPLLKEDPSAKAGVLCHSLGTIVMHDTLALLGSQPLDGNRFFMPPGFRFDSLFSVANVSRLGPYDLDPYNTCVRPVSAPNAGGGATLPYLDAMYSFRHRWDPFTLWQSFDRDDWGNAYIQPAPLEHVHSANPHGFTHYLDHPTVHVPLINRALNLIAISKKEREEKLASYPSIAPAACGMAIQRLKERAEQLTGAVSNPKDLNQVVQAGIAFYTAVREAANTCPELIKGYEGD